MKYQKGKVVNLPAIKTLEQFLLDNELENVINFAPLINRNLIYYKLTNGDIKIAIQYNQPIKINDIELAIVKQVFSGKLLTYAMLDTASGFLIVQQQNTTIKNIKLQLDNLIKKIGETKFIETIKNTKSLTQATLKSELLKTL